LIRDTVLVVQHFKDLGEGLDNSGVLVAIQLDDVDEANLSLGGAAEWLEDGSRFLMEISAEWTQLI
jgi:hypothetical protein